MKNILIGLIINILLLSPIFPQTVQKKDISQKDIDLQNKLSDPKSVKRAADEMEEWKEKALSQFGIPSLGEYKGKFFIFAKQTVSLKPMDPQYGDAFVNAYDKAMMEIQKKYLMMRFGSTLINKSRKFYSDRSTNAKEIPLPSYTPTLLNKILLIFNKSLDVAEKKLDKELIKLGVDPSEIQNLTPKQKKDIFRDKFIKITIRKASGWIRGIFPIQTNVIIDKNGTTVIGVLAVWSPKTEQIVKDISLQRKPLIKGKGRDLRSLLPDSPEEFIATLGIRLVYDIDGTPAILSYGLGSYRADTDDDYINDELENEAYQNAISNADGQIAEVINGYMNVNVNRKCGEEIRKYVERELKPDSDTIEKTIKNIIKITRRIIKSSASAKLQGISTLKRWKYTNKYGVKFVGVVRVWRYSTLKAIKSIYSQPQKIKKKTNKRSTKQYMEFKKSSKPVNTINDF